MGDEGDDGALHVDDPDEATTNLTTAEAACTTAEADGDRENEAIAMIQAANALSILGRANEALEKANRALEIAEDIMFDVGRGAALATIGRVCAVHGSGEDDMELGYDSVQDALRLFRKMSNKRGQAIALWSMALLENSFGKPHQCVRFANDAIAILNEIGAGALEAIVCQTMADGYLNVGDFRRAISSVERAHTINVTLGERRQEANCLHVIAKISMQEMDADVALEAFRKARAAFNAIGDYEGEAKVLDSERELHLRRDDFPAMCRVSKEIVTLFHKASDHKREGRALLKFSELQLENGDIDKSQKLAKIALDIAQSAGDATGLKDAWEVLGSAKHENLKQEIQNTIDRHSPYMHLPKNYIIDPALNKRVQQSYNDAMIKQMF